MISHSGGQPHEVGHSWLDHQGSPPAMNHWWLSPSGKLKPDREITPFSEFLAQFEDEPYWSEDLPSLEEALEYMRSIRARVL